MNDEIKRLNEENERQNTEKSEGNFSQADKSSITTNEEDKRRSMAEGIISDLSNQRTDIDSIKQAIQMIGEQMNKITTALNQGVQTQGATSQPEPGQLNMESLSALGDLLEKGVVAYKSLKGDGPQAPQIIDQNFINEKMKQSFMDNLQTGEAITNFIKDSLKKKVTREVINTSLKDMGNDTHAPQ